MLRATRELLEEVGYLRLTIAAIAERAGTNKPAIYRRWPTKAHLVHEAVFPSGAPPVEPSGADLRVELRALVVTGVDLLASPAARAATPGLLAELTGDPARHAEILARFAGGTWGWLQARIDRAVAAGEVRPGVRSTTVLELVAGAAFIATALRPDRELDPEWVDGVVDVIMNGIEGDGSGSGSAGRRGRRDGRQQGDGSGGRRGVRGRGRQGGDPRPGS